MLQNFGYQSKANMTDATTFEERTIEFPNKQMKTEMVNLAAAVEDVIYEAENNGMPVPPVPVLPNETAHVATVANSKVQQLLTLLKAMGTHLQKIESR